MLDSKFIKQKALEVGFSLCGIASYELMQGEAEHLDLWLKNSCKGELNYMNRYADLRKDVGALMNDTKSIISLGVNYKNNQNFFQNNSASNKFASYSLMIDYHFTLKAMMSELITKLESEYGSISTRMCVDSAPVFEKAWAVRAGLGVVGRNSLLITPQYGSMVLLCEILIDKTVDCYDSAMDWNPCQGCDNCIKACPASAINDNKTLDANRCISALTTHPQSTDKSPEQLHGWVFGCEVCQRACPQNNMDKAETQDARFLPLITSSNIEKEQFLALEKREFKKIFSKTPIFRTKFEVLRQRMVLNKN